MAEITLKNPHLAELKVDNFYHLGFNTAQDLPAMFGTASGALACPLLHGMAIATPSQPLHAHPTPSFL